MTWSCQNCHAVFLRAGCYMGQETIARFSSHAMAVRSSCEGCTHHRLTVSSPVDLVIRTSTILLCVHACRLLHGAGDDRPPHHVRRREAAAVGAAAVTASGGGSRHHRRGGKEGGPAVLTRVKISWEPKGFRVDAVYENVASV